MERSSTDFPEPGAADDAQHLAAIDVEIDVIVDAACRRSRLTTPRSRMTGRLPRRSFKSP